jgi:hypothetical protein
MGDFLFDDVLSQGTSFKASAQPFSEFSLFSGQGEILRLRYVFDAEIEKRGGVAYHCEYSGREWTLQFFRTPYLQRESYRVLCGSIVVAETEVFRIFRSAEIVFSDGAIWHCHVGIIGSEVKNSNGERILHTLPNPGLILGGSSLHIDHAVELERALPVLIILMHSTTHSSQ